MRRSILAIVAICLAGCASTSSMLTSYKLMTGYAEPTRILTLLSPMSIGNGGKGLLQGMMCRVYFFREEGSPPIKVSGELVVTAHDPKNPIVDKAGKQVANGVYMVDAQRLPGHMRRDQVGDSYVFWFPYEPKEESEIIVKVAFKSDTNRELEGNPVVINLKPVSVSNAAESKMVEEEIRLGETVKKDAESASETTPTKQ